MSDKKYISGLWCNEPHPNAPDFIIAEISLLREKFIQWLQEQEASEKGYVKLTVLKSQDGAPYVKLNDWKPSGARKQPTEGFGEMSAEDFGETPF